MTPDQVMGPSRPGRTIVITGDTAPSPATVSAAAVTAKVTALRAEGKTVSAQRAIPEKLRYATLCDLRKEGEK